MKYANSDYLKIRIKLLKPTIKRDDSGGTIISGWNFYKKVWARYEPYKNLLYKVNNFENVNFFSEDLTFFHIRYSNNITNKMRINYKERDFQIIRLINLNNQFIHISAKEIIND